MCVYPVAILGAEAAWSRSTSTWPISTVNRDKEETALEVLRQKQELRATCWQSPALGDGDSRSDIRCLCMRHGGILAYN